MTRRTNATTKPKPAEGGAVLNERDGNILMRSIAAGAAAGGLTFLRATMGEAEFVNAVSRVRLREPIVRSLASHPVNDQRSPSAHVHAATPIAVMDHPAALPVPSPTAAPSKYLDEKQLCSELSISSVTATKWRRNAEGPAFVRVGRLIRYPRESVDAWLASRTVGVSRPREPR